MTILYVRPHAQKVWPDVKFPGAASLASVLELQLLSESGRLRVGGGSTIAQVVHDERWVLGDRALIARLNPGEVVER